MWSGLDPPFLDCRAPSLGQRGLEVVNEATFISRRRNPDELWTEAPDIVQETGIKTIPMENKCKKAKWLSEEALQIAVKRGKKQRRKGKI